MRTWWQARSRGQKAGIIAGALVVLALVGVGIFFIVRSLQPEQVNLATASPTPTPFIEFRYQAEAGKNPLALLRTRAVVTEVIISGSKQVQSINGKANTGTAVWMLYVNDRLVSDPPETVILNADDQVTWRFNEL
jgi:hypothetical protein